jgi:hypothetical protein
VAAPPETLEARVRNELRGPVSELVRHVILELVREQLNGAAETAVSGPDTPRSRAYAPALAEDEEPHPGPGSQDGHKSQRRLDSDRYWNERRRALIEEARVSTEERDGREYVVRHLAPQFGAVSE